MVIILLSSTALAQEFEKPFKNLKAFNGNTHAHTIFSYSHGSHLERPDDFSKEKGDKMLYVDSLHLSRPNKALLKEDWDSFQGLPEVHYQEAKKADYDFYFVTDHSQEEAFFPDSKNNTAWTLATKQAEIATDTNFSAIMGVEHSENDSYKTRVHLNVIGPSSYVNALRPGVDIPYLYDWLKNNPINKNTGNPVVVQFNHPKKNQFNDFVYRDDDLIDIITQIEVINNTSIHYEGFIEALENGWKVSPTAGLDNHNYTAIATAQARTFILAENNTPKDLLTAMRQRRTYASFDKNLECRYTVNDSLMGSTIDKTKKYSLKIYINDADVGDESDKISKVEILTGTGKVLKSLTIDKILHQNYWNITLKGSSVEDYIFIRVWDNFKSDQDQPKPVAWLAPIWIGNK
ncbi:hypothetical protein [Maribacter litoralis]|uniref:hypothetical protein n=1 Tax=Maribacter litoralis TaxID=2059726 RepID=UPI003F5CBDED